MGLREIPDIMSGNEEDALAEACAWTCDDALRANTTRHAAIAIFIAVKLKPPAFAAALL
jgi:hypothetical protein